MTQSSQSSQSQSSRPGTVVQESRRSLGTPAARTLATTTKSVPQMQGISPRWLLRLLPWVQASGGSYRVNRRRRYPVGDGRDSTRATNKYGEADIAIASGHIGEPELPTTYADYELTPREYELSVAQTVLHIHTRVADLYNQPMNQTEQQLRLTIEALRERQEHELINNREFGLLHNADPKQRIRPRTGPPAPDDMDELLCRRRGSRFFLAHPRAIAAFGRECSKRGVYAQSIETHGTTVPAWRGVPIFPCDKIPIDSTQTSSILVLRTGEEDQGVIGLHQTGIPYEYEPSLSVRFMGINDHALVSYLVSAYYSAAILVPDALGILEDVEIAR